MLLVMLEHINIKMVMIAKCLQKVHKREIMYKIFRIIIQYKADERMIRHNI